MNKNYFDKLPQDQQEIALEEMLELIASTYGYQISTVELKNILINYRKSVKGLIKED